MSYNGHKSYNAWNVSLWINNDEGLYNTARHYAKLYGRTYGPAKMLEELESMDVTHTPDGVPYTKTNIRLAMVGL